MSQRDPHEGSAWSTPEVVAGFLKTPPNPRLQELAAESWHRSARALDIGCGVGRHAIPLAHAGWQAVGIDLSWPMLTAAATRRGEDRLHSRLGLVMSRMEDLPFASSSFDLVVAHGIWNLARSGRQFRDAVSEAARVARPGAALFVFTFSRHTLPESAEPVAGETFVFTQFSGQPQCFLTAEQLEAEMMQAGFSSDPSMPLRELNRPDRALLAGGPPVIYEAVYRRGADQR
jgi:SAM-dependent methyltransferase